MKKKVLLILLLTIALKTEAQTSVFTVVDSLLLQGNYQTALVKLKQERIKNVKTYNTIGTIYQAVGDYTKGIMYYKKALEFKENEVSKVKLGRAYELTGFSGKAMNIYESIIEKDSSNLLVVNSLGKLYLSHSKPKSAGTLYEYLLKRDSLNPNYHYQLGQSYLKRGRKSEMADKCLDAYELDSLHMKSIYSLAKFFKGIREKDSTKLFIDKGLAINENNLNLIQLNANYLYTAKDYEGTIENLKKLGSLNFKSANIYSMIGMSYVKLEQLDSAEVYFLKGFRMGRDNPKITFRLAKLYHEKNELKKAMSYAQFTTMQLRTKVDDEYYFLGILQKENGDTSKAIKSFDIAYKSNPRNHEALFQLAMASDAYYKEKNIALGHYQKYLKKFKSKDLEMAEFAQSRIDVIVKMLFLDGEIVESN